MVWRRSEASAFESPTAPVARCSSFVRMTRGTDGNLRLARRLAFAGNSESRVVRVLERLGRGLALLHHFRCLQRSSRGDVGSPKSRFLRARLWRAWHLDNIHRGEKHRPEVGSADRTPPHALPAEGVAHQFAGDLVGGLSERGGFRSSSSNRPQHPEAPSSPTLRSDRNPTVQGPAGRSSDCRGFRVGRRRRKLGRRHHRGDPRRANDHRQHPQVRRLFTLRQPGRGRHVRDRDPCRTRSTHDSRADLARERPHGRSTRRSPGSGPGLARHDEPPSRANDATLPGGRLVRARNGGSVASGWLPFRRSPSRRSREPYAATWFLGRANEVSVNGVHRNAHVTDTGLEMLFVGALAAPRPT